MVQSWHQDSFLTERHLPPPQHPAGDRVSHISTGAPCLGLLIILKTWVMIIRIQGSPPHHQVFVGTENLNTVPDFCYVGRTQSHNAL